MLARRSPSTSRFTFKRIQASGRGKAVLGSFSALDIRQLKRTAYLYSFFFFLLQVIFHWNEYVLFEPQAECFTRAVSGLGSRSVDCDAEADSDFRGPRSTFPLKGPMGAVYQEHFCAFSRHHPRSASLWYLGLSYFLRS